MIKPTGLTFWFDVETTGLNHRIHGITELAFIIEKEGEVIEENATLVKPFHTTVIDPKALEKQGRTFDDLDKQPPVKVVYEGLKKTLGKFVDPYDKHDKFVPAGYNVNFDLDFLKGMFTSMGDKFFYSWFFAAPIDVRGMVGRYLLRYNPMLPNLRLETLCGHFGIPIEAHQALEDIRATRALYYKIEEVLRNG